MKKMNEKLSEIFDVEPVKFDDEIIKPIETIELESKDPVEDDANFARDNIRNLIDKGSDAVNELAAVARDSQHPRAYEVMATLIKNISDMNKDLLEIQKRKRDLSVVQKSNDVNIDKAVFVGSTNELMKLIKNKG